MYSVDRFRVIGRTYRHLARYQQIARVLFTYGFGDLLDALHVRRYIEPVVAAVSRRYRSASPELLSRPERVRRALEELGPTFVKLGQVLSTRPDLIPMEYARALAHLQDHVEPFPFDEVARIVSSETGARLEDVFRSFDQAPVAAASIAQGHRAELPDGTEVFVKVQRPGIEATIAVDLEIMQHLATLLEHHSSEISFLKPTRIVDEFRRTLEREIDFTIEAANADRFARQFAGDPTIRVPRVFHELTTSKVITQEYIRGIKVSQREQLEAAGCNPKQIAARGANLLMRQFFEHGFFHADPHPGNVYVLPGDVVCYVDFGMMGRIALAEREHFADLLGLAVTRDERRAVRVLLGLTLWEDEPDHGRLERDLADFIDDHLYRPVAHLDVPKMLQEVYLLCLHHGLALRPHIYLLMKTLGAVDEMGRQLDPEFRIVDHLAPFVRRLQRRRLSPLRLLSQAAQTGGEAAGLLQDLPGEIRTVFRQVREGRVKVEFEHRGLESMLHTHSRMSNRLASAIVLGSLIVGSSLMALSDIPPKWNGMPIIGIGGFVVAAFLGLMLLWSILRSG